jgi:hypothetical protein
MLVPGESATPCWQVPIKEGRATIQQPFEAR